METAPLRQDPPPDVERRAADEIDYFTLVFRDRYGGNVWKIPQARTISEFFGECESAEDLQRRVAASPRWQTFFLGSTRIVSSTQASVSTSPGSESVPS